MDFERAKIILPLTTIGNLSYLGVVFNQFTRSYQDISEDFDLDSDCLVRMNRDQIQEVIDADVSVFTEEELREIQKADEYVLSHVDDAVRYWGVDVVKRPESMWWNYLPEIIAGKMPRPDLDAIYNSYFEKLKGK